MGLQQSRKDAARKIRALAYEATDFFALEGVNRGTCALCPEEAVLGDLYKLEEGAMMDVLSLAPGGAGGWYVADDTALGQAGARLLSRMAVTFMRGNGRKITAEVWTFGKKGATQRQEFVIPFSQFPERAALHFIDCREETQISGIMAPYYVALPENTKVMRADGQEVAARSINCADRLLSFDGSFVKVELVQRGFAQLGEGHASIDKDVLGNSAPLHLSRQCYVTPTKSRGMYKVAPIRLDKLVGCPGIHESSSDTMAMVHLLLERKTYILANGVAVQAGVGDLNKHVTPSTAKQIAAIKPATRAPLNQVQPSLR